MSTNLYLNRSENIIQKRYRNMLNKKGLTTNQLLMSIRSQILETSNRNPYCFLVCIHDFFIKFTKNSLVQQKPQQISLELLQKQFCSGSLTSCATKKQTTLQSTKMQDESQIKIVEIIKASLGELFASLSDFIAHVYILNASSIFCQQNKGLQTIKILAGKLQKLRFLIQIENMERMEQQKQLIQFQKIIQEYINKCLTIDYTAQTLSMMRKVMECQISNTPKHLILMIDNVIQKKTQNMKYIINQNKGNQVMQKNRPSIFNHLKIREEKLKENKLNQQTKRPEWGQNFSSSVEDSNTSSNQNQKSNKSQIFSNKAQKSQLLFLQTKTNLKKNKMIQKTRTIYHQRKNVFCYKTKKYSDNSETYASTQRSESIDFSTQWSASLLRQGSNSRVSSNHKVKSQSITSLDTEFDDDFLVAKTPKQAARKILHFQQSTSFRLDFSN